jgi:hypothetical protein
VLIAQIAVCAKVEVDSLGDDKQTDSEGAVCQQGRDTVDDGIASIAARTADDVCGSIQGKGLMADRTDEPAKVFRVQGGLGRGGWHGVKYKVLGSGFGVRGSRFEVRGSR